MHFDRRECLKRAKVLFSQKSEADMRYACLELRFCMESIAYEKLRTYAKRLPAAVLETWQPPQIFKALREFEPSADQDFSLRFCAEDARGQPTGEWTSLGTHKTFRLSWLRKTYNALGNRLHVPLHSVSGVHAQLDESKAALERLVEEAIRSLEPMVETRMDCSIATVVEFQCGECKSVIVRSLDGLEKDPTAICLNSNCRAEYHAKKDEKANTFEFLLKASDFSCTSCQSSITVENRKLEVGFIFKCPKCNSKHQVLKRQWGYALHEEDPLKAE